MTPDAAPPEYTTENPAYALIRHRLSTLAIIMGVFGAAILVGSLTGTLPWLLAPTAIAWIGGGVYGVQLWRFAIVVWAARRFAWRAAACLVAGAAWYGIVSLVAG